MNNNIIQPISTIVLHVRSKDAKQLSTGYNTNFDINLTNAISIKENQEIHISVSSAEIPYSFYNVSSELKNNTLIYDDTQTLTFTSQDYDIDQLVEFFENDTNFKAIFDTTYDSQKNKISFKNTTSATHKINLSISNLNKEIGFSEIDTDRTITSGSTLTSTYVCNLATVHSIFIKSSLSTANVLSTRSGNSTILQKISVDTNSLLCFISDLFSIIITNTRSINIPTQSNTITRTERVDDDDLNQLNATHPIENKSEIKHKSDRIILDNLLEIVSDQ